MPVKIQNLKIVREINWEILVKLLKLLMRSIVKFLMSYLPNIEAPQLIAKHLNEPDPDHPDRHRVLGVFVHYSDCLKLDFHVLHPVLL